jgi:hypothetical protein
MGLERLLSSIEDDLDVNDVRWAAYMLATVKLECAGTWQRVKEFGCFEGRNPVCTPLADKNGVMHDRRYRNPVPCPKTKIRPPRTCPAGKTEHHYYGRGYVQLTHQANHEAMSQAEGQSGDTMTRPASLLASSRPFTISSLVTDESHGSPSSPSCVRSMC